MSDNGNARRDALVTGNGAGRSFKVGGGEITIKVSTHDTGGAFATFEGRTEPLDGPPLHMHYVQDECFYILEGEYKFEVDGQEIFVGAGDTVFAPRGSRHTFQVVGKTAGRALTTVIPGGLDLFFEKFAKAVSPETMPDPVKLAPLFHKHGLELLGPPLAARPLQAKAS
jgi:mannose-6-phosphate isomerase-like protein (cupin superfamily)